MNTSENKKGNDREEIRKKMKKNTKRLLVGTQYAASLNKRKGKAFLNSFSGGRQNF